MNIALILAGGTGTRVGATDNNGQPIPKQFVNVFDKPVLAYTIEAFETHPQIDAIEVVCVPSYIEYMNELKNRYNFSKLKWVCEGGATFQESVMNGVNYLEEKVDPNDIVLIHFGASPFIAEDIITSAIEVCKEKGNAISTTDFYVLPGIKDSTKSVEDPNNYSSKYIDRDTIACMSSPHAFRYELIYRIYQEAIDTGVINEVEPHTTSLMFALGYKIFFSKGSQTNIKITRKEDLELFKGYMMFKNSKIHNFNDANDRTLF